MNQILYILLTSSISAAIVIGAVLLARVALRRAPKIFSYMLWAVVLFRLVCPFGIDTGFGIVPELTFAGGLTAAVEPETKPVGTVAKAQNAAPVDRTEGTRTEGSAAAPAPDIEPTADSGEASVDTAATAAEHSEAQSAWSVALFCLWLAGMAAALGWYALSWFRLRRTVSTATRVNGDSSGRIYQSDQIGTAFVFGMIKPRIYLPTWLDAAAYRCVVAHEQVHLRRFDYIIKPLAFVVTSVYWFNPFCWLAYVLMCRDMEMICDEAVLRKFGDRVRTGYVEMLLGFGTRRLLSVETAFGETAAKARIRNALTCRKPTRLAFIAAAMAVLLVTAACVGTAGRQEQTASPSDAAVSETDAPIRYVEYIVDDAGISHIPDWEWVTADDTGDDQIHTADSAPQKYGRSYDSTVYDKLFALLDWRSLEPVGENHEHQIPMLDGMDSSLICVIFDEHTYCWLDANGRMVVALYPKEGARYEAAMDVYYADYREADISGGPIPATPEYVLGSTYIYDAPDTLYAEARALLDTLPAFEGDPFSPRADTFDGFIAENGKYYANSNIGCDEIEAILDGDLRIYSETADCDFFIERASDEYDAVWETFIDAGTKARIEKQAEYELYDAHVLTVSRADGSSSDSVTIYADYCVMKVISGGEEFWLNGSIWVRAGYYEIVHYADGD